MIRRYVLKSIAALALWPGLARAEAGTPFSGQSLDDLARQIAAQPYAKRPLVADAWRALTYDQYRGIRYNTGKAIWAGTDTTLEFDMFPPGLYFPHTVEVNMVENGMARKMPFDFSLYDLHEIVPDRKSVV
jgi:glucans biosynthesis protein